MPHVINTLSSAATIDALGEALDALEIGVVVLDSDLRPTIINQPFLDRVKPPRIPIATLEDLLGALSLAAGDGIACVEAPSILDGLTAAMRSGSVAVADVSLCDGTRLRLRGRPRRDGGHVLTCADTSAEDPATHPVTHHRDLAEQLTVELRFNNETLESQAAYLASLAEAADANAQAAEDAKRRLEHEVKERRQLEAQLRRMATIDALTGVLNRAHLLTLGQREVERVRQLGVGLAVLMLDIDFFKAINDRYGHPGGDTALQHLVSVLRSGIRRIDLLGRLGGEEFAVVLPAIADDAAEAVAERLRMLVAQSSCTYGADSITMTISIGVARLRDEDLTVERVLARADAALYEAKRAGRNRIACDNVVAAAA